MTHHFLGVHPFAIATHLELAEQSRFCCMNDCTLSDAVKASTIGVNKLTGILSFPTKA